MVGETEMQMLCLALAHPEGGCSGSSWCCSWCLLVELSQEGHLEAAWWGIHAEERQHSNSRQRTWLGESDLVLWNKE